MAILEVLGSDTPNEGLVKINANFSELSDIGGATPGLITDARLRELAITGG